MKRLFAFMMFALLLAFARGAWAQEEDDGGDEAATQAAAVSDDSALAAQLVGCGRAHPRTVVARLDCLLAVTKTDSSVLRSAVLFLLRRKVVDGRDQRLTDEEVRWLKELIDGQNDLARLLGLAQHLLDLLRGIQKPDGQVVEWRVILETLTKLEEKMSRVPELWFGPNLDVFVGPYSPAILVRLVLDAEIGDGAVTVGLSGGVGSETKKLAVAWALRGDVAVTIASSRWQGVLGFQYTGAKSGNPQLRQADWTTYQGLFGPRVRLAGWLRLETDVMFGFCSERDTPGDRQCWSFVGSAGARF